MANHRANMYVAGVWVLTSPLPVLQVAGYRCWVVPLVDPLLRCFNGGPRGDRGLRRSCHLAGANKHQAPRAPGTGSAPGSS